MNGKQFYTYQEQTFDSYCKRIIRNERMNALKELARRAEHEITFSMLPESSIHNMGKEDLYQLEKVSFCVRGENVVVHDKQIGVALQSIPPKLRDVILLFYFQDMHDTQIAGILKVKPQTVHYRRKAGLTMLRILLEGYEHGA